MKNLLGINIAELERIFTAAKNNQVFFMEALRSRFNPTKQKSKLPRGNPTRHYKENSTFILRKRRSI